ncbi:hypothetical protein Fmac_012736 [Flemingia macrophylla]|uniref:Uncharacterized protein n=1 Tax=Flemingia macrophylla TaxID=520843 RepID=A0ABD1MR56_9FABA
MFVRWRGSSMVAEAEAEENKTNAMADVDGETSESPKRQANNGLVVTIAAFLGLTSKRLKGNKPKPKPKPSEWKKKLLSNISNKALGHGQSHKHSGKEEKEKESEKDAWGNGGVWQKEILMGGKCQPLNFSGVIYYDGNGKQLSQIPPRSPRASPLPAYLTRRPLQ